MMRSVLDSDRPLGTPTQYMTAGIEFVDDTPPGSQTEITDRK